MQIIDYRLAEYKITESEHGDLWWENHFGLGSLKSGKCFINGDILFLKPSNITGPGFLKGEFLDHLSKLPKWEKTKYYCTSYKIYKCKFGSRKQFFQESDSWSQYVANHRNTGSTLNEVLKDGGKSVKINATEQISYKLGHYEIIESIDGRLSWKSHRGLVNSKAGKCHINGHILFIEPTETKVSSPKKREFVQKLTCLPDWERTKYFCTMYAIYYSKTGARCRSLGEDIEFKEFEAKIVDASDKMPGTGIKIVPIIL